MSKIVHRRLINNHLLLFYYNRTFQILYNLFSRERLQFADMYTRSIVKRDQAVGSYDSFIVL